MEEIWKDIRNYEGYYQISNRGRVKSLSRVVKYKSGKGYKTIPERILVIKDNGNGYRNISLCREGYQVKHYIHRSVAQAFLSNPDNKPQVNHIDHDKDNNCVSNLEWCTQKENTAAGIKLGKINNKKRGKTKKFTEWEICRIAHLKFLGKGIQEIAKLLQYPRTSISSVVNGRSNKELYDFTLQTLKEKHYG